MLSLLFPCLVRFAFSSLSMICSRAPASHHSTSSKVQNKVHKYASAQSNCHCKFNATADGGIFGCALCIFKSFEICNGLMDFFYEM